MIAGFNIHNIIYLYVLQLNTHVRPSLTFETKIITVKVPEKVKWPATLGGWWQKWSLFQSTKSFLHNLYWDLKPRSILATHAFDLVGIKRSWHITEGGSVIVGVERVSVTNRYPACKA